MRRSRSALTLATALAVLVPLAGCSGYQTFRQAQQAEQEGNWDQAVLHYMEAVETYPDNLTYRAALMRARVQAAQGHFQKGREYYQAGVLERARFEFRQAIELDPANQYAVAELEKVAAELRALREDRDPVRSIDELKERTRGTRAQPPILNPRSEEPIDLLFPDPVSVLDIYQALGKAFGVNVLFDPKLKDQEIAIELNDVTAQSGLEILMRTVGHFYKVLDEHSIIIADDNPQNRRNYEDQVIQTFFLSNAEVKDVMQIIRSLISAKHVAANEQLNAIVLRDTADKVKVAEQIILSNDKAKAEVVVDVELLQINSTKLQELGMSLTSYQIRSVLDTGVSTGEGSAGGGVRLSDVEFLNANNWMVNIPGFVFDFMKSATDAQILAQPKLRISEGEKGTFTVGDRIPIPTTTFNTSNVAGTNIVPVTSFQYQEVGIKVDIEPRVHHNDQVSMKVRVEVSDLAGSVENPSGQDQPIIGQRTIETSIRLSNGETNFLAGLIRTEEIEGDLGIPGLSNIPVLGRLFSSKRNDSRRSDIVLTLTPHIIRRADIKEEDLVPIWVGTEANITFRGGSPRVESDVSGPFDGDSARSRVEERLRRRLRSLPRGLQDVNGEDQDDELDNEDEGDPEEEPANQGVDLVPPSGLEGGDG